MSSKTIHVFDDNIRVIREKYPNGLHFAVGDIHGQVDTLRDLMDKIQFNPQKDHAYFVGDYNEGGDVHGLLSYLAMFYQADYEKPGFHLIRGNHEREMCPVYPLDNLPDVIVYPGEHMNYYLVHAGMVAKAFELIGNDVKLRGGKEVCAYRLDESCAGFDAPLRMLTWSRKRLYRPQGHNEFWPSEQELYARKAIIIHGHTPYCFMKKGDNEFLYGGETVYWENQHIVFAEDLQSFDIDSNIKGRYENNEGYRGLSCLCLEVIDRIAGENGCWLSTVDVCHNKDNFVFSAVYRPIETYEAAYGNTNIILQASPRMKTVTLADNGEPVIV